jgi:hypothetical protein
MQNLGENFIKNLQIIVKAIKITTMGHFLTKHFGEIKKKNFVFFR